MAGDFARVLTGSQLGFTFVLYVGGFFYAGLKVDERLGTLPLFALLGFLIGFGLGFYTLYVSVMRPKEKDQDPGG